MSKECNIEIHMAMFGARMFQNEKNIVTFWCHVEGKIDMI